MIAVLYRRMLVTKPHAYLADVITEIVNSYPNS
jgi:hypothetical protein